MAQEADQILVTLVAGAAGKDEKNVTSADIEVWRAKLAYVHPGKETAPTSATTASIQPWGGFPRAVDRQAPWSNHFSPVPGVSGQRTRLDGLS